MERIVITDWQIADKPAYVQYALGLALLIRVISSLLRGLELARSMIFGKFLGSHSMPLILLPNRVIGGLHSS